MIKNAPTATDLQVALEALGQIESRMAAFQHELDRLGRLATLGTLTAGLAHEIQNLITPASSYAQLAQARPDDAGLQIKAISKSLEATRRISQISELILSFVRSDARPQFAHKADVCSTWHEAQDSASVEPCILFHTQLATELAVCIHPVALHQILLNLILNAARAIKQGGSITLRARLTETVRCPDVTWAPLDPMVVVNDDQLRAGPRSPSGRSLWCQLEIADTGPGIPVEQIARIFGAFVSHSHGQAQSGTSRAGTGLGLTICQHLVQQAGGRLGARSLPGQGATFVIQLPVS